MVAPVSFKNEPDVNWSVLFLRSVMQLLLPRFWMQHLWFHILKWTLSGKIQGISEIWYLWIVWLKYEVKTACIYHLKWGYSYLYLLYSSFADIFDVDHFIHILKDEISIVKDLPREYSWSTREYYATAIRATRVKTAPVHASANWYLENVLPILQRSVWHGYSSC